MVEHIARLERIGADIASAIDDLRTEMHGLGTIGGLRAGVTAHGFHWF